MDAQYPPTPSGGGGGGGHEGEDLADWMRIDLAALDACLRRLPMHERLRLPRHVGEHLERTYGVDPYGGGRKKTLAELREESRCVVVVDDARATGEFDAPRCESSSGGGGGRGGVDVDSSRTVVGGGEDRTMTTVVENEGGDSTTARNGRSDDEDDAEDEDVEEDDDDEEEEEEDLEAWLDDMIA